jgi:hypothetical protein
MSTVLTEARNWVTEHYGKHAIHLIKAEEWLNRINPAATEAMQLATVTHDMERAFPEPDSPKVDPEKGPDDPIYNTAHAERSARVVSDYLRHMKMGVGEELVEEVATLIRAHEFGGWPEANWVQAADSLSFLEVNIDYFVGQIGAPDSNWTPEYVKQKFDWMYERIQVAEARTLAAPLHEQALGKLRDKVGSLG